MSRVTTWVAFVTCLVPAIVVAQQQTSPLNTESILRYLEQDLSIQPGVGFRKVRLGQSFASVAQIWGRPSSTERSGLLKVTNKWYYRAGDTQIILVGGKTVESIEVSGRFNSPFQTTEGARFGMSPHQVTAIYGLPNRSEGLTYFGYTHRGIEFAMQNGTVRALRVFPAGTTN